MADHLVEAALIGSGSGSSDDAIDGNSANTAAADSSVKPHTNGASSAANTTTTTTSSGGGLSSSEVVDFSTSLTTWREINLPSVQSYFATLCPKLVEAQREALISRKRLAEQTREFKRAKRIVPTQQDEAAGKVEEEVTVEEDEQREARLKALLKAYQTEIDELTKRAKNAENAVLGVRDRLKDASDPYPILEAVVEQTATLADLETLRGQVTQLSLDNASLQTQLPALEAERSRLQERVVKLEAGMESRAKEQRGAMEAELNAKWDERWRNQVAREEDLTRALNVAQTQLRDLRQSHARATERLLEHGEDVERGETGGRIEELDVVSEELRRTTERLQSVERRNEQLREEMEKIKSGSADEAKLQDAEAKRVESEEEVRRLTKLFEAESVRAKQGQEELERRAREAERAAKEKERENEGLRDKVRQMADYDEVKRELDIFKSVEFSTGTEDDGEDGYSLDTPDQNGAREKASGLAKPLEALLIEKNKQLQDELATMRVSQGELSHASASTTKELESLRGEVKRLKSLNERLEDDLVNMRPGDGKAKSKALMSAEETLAEMDRLGAEAVLPSSSPSGSKEDKIKKDPIPFVETKNAPASAAQSSSSDSSILPIITGQRDRFRARNAELEEELRRQFETITELRNEVKTLQADNLSLYEKVRYLQAYSSMGNDTSASSSSSLRNHYPDARIVNVSARNDVGAYPPAAPVPRTGLGRGEEKYRDKYEAAMNPFERFRGNVSLSLHETEAEKEGQNLHLC